MRLMTSQPYQEQLLEELQAARRELNAERQARRGLEESLRLSEERYQALYKHAPVMLHSIDRDGLLISVSDRWLEVLGYERDEVLGRRSTEFLSVDSQRYARETVLPDYFRTGICRDVPYQFLTKSGEVREILLSAIAERDAQGQHMRSFAVLIDITERKRIEQEFHRAQKLESLGVLASGIAHDFNNLLVGIYGFLDLALLELDQDSKSHGFVGEAKKAAQHSADLIAQLLTYAGRGRTQMGPVDLNGLIEGMTDLLRTSASKKIRLRFEPTAGLPATQGDATKLRQIVMNLVTNAAQAIGEVPGEIVVSTALSGACPDSPGGEHLSLRVKDTGPGLDEETRARIFDPFFTTKDSGSGLGLAAVHGIVRSHGGTIRVDSEPGEGSCFCICLPLAKPRGTVPARGPHLSSDWQGRGTLLLVDDEPAVRRVAEAMLVQLGFDVLTATDGANALEMFQAHQAQITGVLLDYKMPHMDGEEVFHKLLELQPDLTVVLSSGYTAQQTTERLASEGLAGFIQKPYELEGLRRALSEALGQP
jgi:PAS domain S-box-containing protein